MFRTSLADESCSHSLGIQSQIEFRSGWLYNIIYFMVCSLPLGVRVIIIIIIMIIMIIMIITLAVGLSMRIRNPEFAIATTLVAANWI